MSDNLKLIFEPSVYVIGSQTVDREEVNRFLSDTGYQGPPLDYAPSASENLVEIGGRLCYRSYGRGRPHDQYIAHILESGHGSVLEHAVWALIITGISRTLSHELVRHRVGLSPSMESQRYVNASDVAFVVPPALLRGRKVWEDGGFRNDSPLSDTHAYDAYRAWHDSCQQSLVEYRTIIGNLERMEAANLSLTESRKRVREAARSVLPGCAETRIQLTGNARAWRSMIELRASEHADAEIRRLAVAVLRRLKPLAPNLFGDFEEVSLSDGSVGARAKWHKV